MILGEPKNRLKKCPFADCQSVEIEYLEPSLRRDLTLISCSNCKREYSIVESALDCSNEHLNSIRFSDFENDQIYFRCIIPNCKNKLNYHYDFKEKELLKIKNKLPNNLILNGFSIRPRVIKNNYENNNFTNIKSIIIHTLDMYNEVYNVNTIKRSYLAEKIHNLKYTDKKLDLKYVENCVNDFFEAVNKIKDLLNWKFDKILVVPESELRINQDHFMRKLASKLSNYWKVSYQFDDIRFVLKGSQKTKNIEPDKRTQVAFEKFEVNKVLENRVLLLDDVMQTGSSMIALNNKLIKENPDIKITNLGIVRTGMK
jgi:predicted amidophosphoribosyltransferase